MGSVNPYLQDSSLYRKEFQKVFQNQGIVETLFQNKKFVTVEHDIPVFVIEEKTKNGAGKKSITFTIKDVNDAIVETGVAVNIGSGTYGDVYYNADRNLVYKIISHRIKKLQKPVYKFQETVNEVAIQIILSKLTYNSQNGHETPMAPAVYGFYKYHSGVKDTLSYVIAMEKAKMAVSDVPNTFRTALLDFSKLLMTLQSFGTRILYNHCDAKLNNFVYDEHDSLQIIDFGFSSLEMVFFDKTRLTLLGGYCGWKDSQVDMSQNMEDLYDGYYIQKDIVQLLLSTYASSFYTKMNDETKAFVENMLKHIGLLRGTVIKTYSSYNHTKGENMKGLFHNAYNYDSDLRDFLFRHKRNALEKLEPARLASNLANANYPKKYLGNNSNTNWKSNSNAESGYNSNALSSESKVVMSSVNENDPKEIYRQLRKAIIENDPALFTKFVTKNFDPNYVSFMNLDTLAESGLINIVESTYPYLRILVEKGANIYNAFEWFLGNVYDAQRIKDVIQKVIAEKVSVDFYKPMREGELSIYEKIKERSQYGLLDQKQIYATVLPIIKKAQPKPGLWGKVRAAFGRGGTRKRGRKGRKGTKRILGKK